MTRHISKHCDIFPGVCKVVCNIFPKFTDIFCSHPSRMAAFFVLREKVADLCELQIMKIKGSHSGVVRTEIIASAVKPLDLAMGI